MTTRTLGLLVLLAFQDPTLRDLVDRLGSGPAAERTRAFERLRSLGGAAAPELKRAAADEDPEIAARSRVLLRSLELRETLPPALLKEFPGLDTRLALDPGEWVSTFEEALARQDCGAPRHPSIGWAELNLLAPQALLAAPSDEIRQELCDLVAEHHLRGALPRLHELLESPNFNTRRRALRAVQQFRSPSSLAPVLRLLEDLPLQHEAIYVLGRFGRAETAALARPYLTHPDPEIRGALLSLLSQLPPADALPLRERLLQDPDPEVRGRALLESPWARQEALARELVALLSSPSADLRRRAFDRMSRPSAAFVPHVRALLRSTDADRRATAARALHYTSDAGAIADLEDLLEDPSPPVRETALATLRTVRPRVPVRVFERRLTDPSAEIRESALMGLLEARDPDAIRVVTDRLHDKDAEGREKAMRTLSSRRIQEAAPEFVRIALTGAGEDRIEALRGLVSLDLSEHAAALVPGLAVLEEEVADRVGNLLVTHRASASIPPLAGLTTHADACVRRRAMEVLGRLGGAEADAAAFRLLDDPDAEVRRSAVEAASPATRRKSVPRLRALLKDPDRELRFAAGEALASIHATEALDDLLPLLTEADQEQEALRILGQLGSRRAVPALLQLLDRVSTRLKIEVMETLHQLDGPEVVAAMRTLANAKNAWVRRTAIEDLAWLEAREAVPDLLVILEEPDASVQDAAARALAELGAREAIPRLMEILRGDAAGARKEILYALARLGAAEAGPRVLELLKQEDWALVQNAVAAAGLLGLKEAVPDLVRIAQGNDLIERPNAVAALFKVGDRRDIAPFLDGEVRNFSSLNRLRRPAACRRLGDRTWTRSVHAPTESYWAELACEAGLEFGLEIDPDGLSTQSRKHRSRGGTMTLLDAIEDAVDSEGYSFILEDDVLRIVTVQAARTFWKEWVRFPEAR